MDVAAAEFYKDGKYDLDFKNANSDKTKLLTGEQLADLYRGFIKDYPSKVISFCMHHFILLFLYSCFY